MQIDDGGHANFEEVDVVIDTMRRAAETDTLFHAEGDRPRARSPWIRARLRFMLRKVLCDWSSGDGVRMERVLPALLTGVRLASGYTAETDLGPIFKWLWPDRKSTFADDSSFKRIWPSPITAQDMTGIARRVVQACYDNPRHLGAEGGEYEHGVPRGRSTRDPRRPEDASRRRGLKSHFSSSTVTGVQPSGRDRASAAQRLS